MHSDLIVFGENWGWRPTGAHHLVRHLGTERKVVWVNSPLLHCCENCLHNRVHPPELARLQAGPYPGSAGEALLRRRRDAFR